MGFGTFWQQILMLVALCISMVMLVVGALLGVVQVLKGPTNTVNFILLIGDSVAALALGAASIAAANVGEGRYFFLRQSIAAWVTMGLFLLMMLFDAAQAFGAAGTEDKKQTYKPTKQVYKPSSKPSQQSKPKDDYLETNKNDSRRQAPRPPKQQMRERPKSVRGEILVALYDYQGQESDELDFNEGDRIELVEDHADGWAYGILLSNRAEGLL